MAWLTKQQAADAIGVSTKTVEKFADDKKLEKQRLRQGNGPKIVVYHSRDVERLRKERNPDAPPFIVPEDSADSSLAVVPDQKRLMQALAAMTSQNFEKRPEVPLSQRLYLNIHESVVYTGLGVGYLKGLVAAGTLSPLKGAGPRGASVFRRADLEKL